MGRGGQFLASGLDGFAQGKLFYVTFGLVTLVAAFIVLVPDAPLVTILIATQVLNAVLLVPLLFPMMEIGRDRNLMGQFAIGRSGMVVCGVTTALVVSCVVALGITSFS